MNLRRIVHSLAVIVAVGLLFGFVVMAPKSPGFDPYDSPERILYLATLIPLAFFGIILGLGLIQIVPHRSSKILGIILVVLSLCVVIPPAFHFVRGMVGLLFSIATTITSSFGEYAIK